MRRTTVSAPAPATEGWATLPFDTRGVIGAACRVDRQGRRGALP
ncbi:hypothetical protein [Streptomyces cirratus]